MKPLTFSTVLFTLTILSSNAPHLCAQEEEGVLVRYAYEQGESFKYKLINRTSQDQMGMKIARNETQFLDWKVLDVDGEEATLEIVYSRITVEMNNPMTGKISFDTAEESVAESPELAYYRAMVEKPFTAKVNTRGEVLEVSGYEKIGQEVMEIMSGLMGDNPGAEPQKKLIASAFTNESMRKQLEQMIVKLPESEVSKQSEWQTETVLTMPPGMGDVISKVDYRLESIEDGTAKILFKGSLEMLPIDESQLSEDDPMATYMKMLKLKEGGTEGTAELDIEAGRIAEKNQKINFTLTMRNQDMSVEQEQILELLESEPEDAEKAAPEQEAATETEE